MIHENVRNDTIVTVYTPKNTRSIAATGDARGHCTNDVDILQVSESGGRWWNTERNSI